MDAVVGKVIGYLSAGCLGAGGVAIWRLTPFWASLSVTCGAAAIGLAGWGCWASKGLREKWLLFAVLSGCYALVALGYRWKELSDNLVTTRGFVAAWRQRHFDRPRFEAVSIFFNEEDRAMKPYSKPSLDGNQVDFFSQAKAYFASCQAIAAVGIGWLGKAVAKGRILRNSNDRYGGTVISLSQMLVGLAAIGLACAALVNVSPILTAAFMTFVIVICVTRIILACRRGDRALACPGILACVYLLVVCSIEFAGLRGQLIPTRLVVSVWPQWIADLPTQGDTSADTIELDYSQPEVLTLHRYGQAGWGDLYLYANHAKVLFGVVDAGVAWGILVMGTLAVSLCRGRKKVFPRLIGSLVVACFAAGGVAVWRGALVWSSLSVTCAAAALAIAGCACWASNSIRKEWSMFAVLGGSYMLVVFVWFSQLADNLVTTRGLMAAWRYGNAEWLAGPQYPSGLVDEEEISLPVETNHLDDELSRYLVHARAYLVSCQAMTAVGLGLLGGVATARWGPKGGEGLMVDTPAPEAEIGRAHV